jgi:hypothetical protein
MAMSRLSISITAPIVLVSALAVGLTVFLNVGKLDRTLGELEQSRLRFTLNNLRENLETGLDLGLPVKGLGNAQAAIDREARADPDIVSIAVLDDHGTVAFRTSRVVDGGSETVRLRTGMSNNLGVTMGAIELAYSRRSHERFMAGISSQLRIAAIVAIIASSALTVLGIRLWVRRIRRTLSSIEHTLDQGTPPQHPDRRAAALAEQVNRSTQDALQELDRAERAITSADVAGTGL